MKPTTQDQARELASNLKASTLMESSRAADYLRSLADQLEAALQDRVALAMQVEALTAELQIKNAECDLFKHGCDIRDAALDKLKKQEPVEHQLLILGERWAHCTKFLYDKSSDRTIVRALYLAAGAQPAEIEALRADSERLDWLEARAHDRSYSIQIRLLRNPEINAGTNRIEVRTGCGSGPWEKPVESSCLRSVIDAAKAKS